MVRRADDSSLRDLVTKHSDLAHVGEPPTRKLSYRRYPSMMVFTYEGEQWHSSKWSRSSGIATGSLREQ